MFSDIRVYVAAVIAVWFTGYWFLTAVPEALSYIVPSVVADKAMARLDQRLSPETRQYFYRVLFVVGIFIAGFLAWDEQYQIAISKSPETLTKQIADLDGEVGRLNKQLTSAAKEKQEHERRWVYRRMRPGKKQQFKTALNAIGPHILNILCNDDDCEPLADDIYEVAKADQWSVDRPPGGLQDRLDLTEKPGISVLRQTGSGGTAGKVRQALVDATKPELRSTIWDGGESHYSGGVTIFFGKKQLPDAEP